MAPVSLCIFAAVALLVCPISCTDFHKFTVGVYKQLAASKPNKNLAFSPFSVETALSMCYIGASGQTRKEMADVLGVEVTASPEALGDKFKAVRNAASDAFTLSTANEIFLERTFEILPTYRDNVITKFGSNISPADFNKNFAAERVRINQFVESKTNNKIKDLLKEDSLDEDSKLVLINAVYFKADWAQKFDETQTRDAPFTTGAGSSKQTKFMHTTGGFDYQGNSAELGGAQLLEMKYKNGEVSMIVILPKKAGHGIQELESSLTPAALESAIASLSSATVEVTLPKFKVEIGYSLAGTLKALGMQMAFTDFAQFPGISGPERPLLISKVEHKVFVEVDEKGTVAAAATAVVMSPGRSASVGPKVFRADRPFIFLITHTQSKAVLFIGKVADPTIEK